MVLNLNPNPIHPTTKIGSMTNPDRRIDRISSVGRSNWNGIDGPTMDELTESIRCWLVSNIEPMTYKLTESICRSVQLESDLTDHGRIDRINSLLVAASNRTTYEIDRINP
jgi:hypothetical protein